MHWEPEAEQRLARAPFFVRLFIKKRAEAAARERGMTTITTALLDELKAREHRGS